MQQHLLLLLNDSVENKKRIDELFTKNQLLTNQLNNDSVENKMKLDKVFTENQLLRKDSAEHKKRIDELFTENQLLTSQLKNDSVENKKRVDKVFTENQFLRKDSAEHKKRIDELFTENQLLTSQLKNDSVENKKRVDKVFTENQFLRKDSAEHRKRIDELFTENKRLNQQLKKTKAGLNLFKENAEKTSDEQMISKLLDQCVTDVCNDFNKILMERYNDYLQKGNQIAYPDIHNSLLRKFCSFEEMLLIEAEVQKCVDQFSKELHKTSLFDDFVQDEILHEYKQNKINSIDEFNKIKIILPSSCWKYANEKMKRCVEICCNFEHMKQGMKFDNYIEARIAQVAVFKQSLEQYRPVLEQENKCLFLGGYHYYQITLASLPVTRSIMRGSYDIELTITCAQNNVISFSFKRKGHGAGFMIGTAITVNPVNPVNPVLVDAGGHQLNLKCIVRVPDIIY